MPILESIEIDLDVEAIATAMRMGNPDARLTARLAGEAPKARELIRPAALYEWLEVEGVEHHDVVLKGSNPDRDKDPNEKTPDLNKDEEIKDGEPGQRRLKLGPLAKLMRPARLALAGVVTIGGDLDREVKALNAADDSLRGYLLDSLGVAALAEVGRALCHVAESEASSRAWGVGRRLAPGSLQGWEMDGQPALCALLPVERIGVSLSDSGVLIPYKSASCLIGIGPNYEDTRTRAVCDLCPRASTCWRKREFA